VTFLLVRVDDRLLHGQVALGWGLRLQPSLYLIADERAATDPWERQAYDALAPERARVEAWAPSRLGSDAGSLPPETILLFRDLASLDEAFRAGFDPDQEINLGGIHALPGSRELLPFLHLLPEAERLLAEMLVQGRRFFAQELPGAPRTEGEQLRRLLNPSSPSSPSSPPATGPESGRP